MLDGGPGTVHRVPLTPQQRARLELVERDLDAARAMDLAVVDPAELIMMVERLRSALHDATRLIHDLSE